MPRVLVVGAGPAGLAAAEALLDGSTGTLDVELVTLGHHLGGKAASWRDPEGRVVEHAQHVVLGFYQELKALLRRSDVSPRETLVPSHGHYQYWEDRDGSSHDLYVGDFLPKLLTDWAGYTGFTHAEKAEITSFVVRLALEIAGPISEELDDLCFSAWALSRGIPASVAQTNLFRANREVQLNWPGEISAYSMLRTLKESISVPGRYLTAYPSGGMSELWWNPIGARIEALGGRIARYQKLVGLEHDGESLTGLTVAQPQWHGPGGRHLASVPVQEATTRTRTDFDAAVIAVPVSAMQEVLPADLAARPGFSGIPRLTAIAPLGLQIWHRETSHARPGTIVGGLEPPLGFALDNKHAYDEYRDDPNVGSVLHFAGQMTGFEEDDDETLVRRALASIRGVKGYEGLDDDGVLHSRVMRHSGPHAHYWDSEPGSLRHKPRSKTPLKGLYLAGDWIRGEMGFPCMETAVRSGREAATHVLRDLKGPRRRWGRAA